MIITNISNGHDSYTVGYLPSTLDIEGDADADALYLRLSHLPVAFTRTSDDGDWAIDYAADSSIVGIEVLGITRRMLPVPADVATAPAPRK